MSRRARPRPVVGIADHSGWAILVTGTSDGTLVDRRRVELVDEGLPTMPHHQEGQKLPLKEAVALVERVRASAERNAKARFHELAIEVDAEIVGVTLRVCQPLPETVAERITDYRAMCIADWVMYRKALAKAASERGWSVGWYDARRVLAEAASALKRETIHDLLDDIKAIVGPPWQKDHRMAMAAAIAAAHGVRSGPVSRKSK